MISYCYASQSNNHIDQLLTKGFHAHYPLYGQTHTRAGIFQDHIDQLLTKGFHAHYPLSGQTHTRAALQQQSILVDMLNALIKAENDLNNIREIVRVEQGGGEQFHASQGQTHASVAERIIKVHGIDRSTN